MTDIQIRNGDALEALREFEDNSFDSCVTDPPYGLTAIPQRKFVDALSHWVGGERDYIPGGKGFMSQQWDRFVPPPALWDEVYRVLKPGAFLACFSGARTFDLMGTSVRLAGFEVTDMTTWVKSGTFPKSKKILKSAHEPILLARKPGADIDGLQVEQRRIPFVSAADEAESKGKNQHAKYGTLHGGNAVYGDFSGGGVRDDYDAPGRWPGNLLLSPEAADALDAIEGVSRSRKGKPRRAEPGNGWGMSSTGAEYDDVGGPSRFFQPVSEDAPAFVYSARAPVRERPVGADGTKHTTVKPLKVMDWLVGLVTPPGGRVLDTFAGSGTTLESCIRGGFDIVALEAHTPFIELIEIRRDRALAAAA